LDGETKALPLRSAPKVETAGTAYALLAGMPRTAMSNHRVLVVDRASNIRCVLAQLLADEGFDVMTANDADEAVLRARALHPAAMLVELESEGDLPTISRLSALPDAGQVIALAPYGGISLALDAMGCGASDYVLNPLSGHELLVVIRKAVEHYEDAHELAELRELGHAHH
ncbi:MAG TPA: response regulator, partial [Kofleriaceae bacterium]